MTIENGRSASDKDNALLSLLGMATKHSLVEIQEEMAIGASFSIFDRCLKHLEALEQSKHVPERDRGLVSSLIEKYKLTLSETPENKLKLKNGAMLDAFMVVIGKTIEKFARSVVTEVSTFIEEGLEDGVSPYQLTVMRFEFTEDVWQVAAINADPDIPTECYINDIKLTSMTTDKFWVLSLLKGVVVAEAVKNANESKKILALSNPLVAANAQKMADILDLDIDECLTMALEFHYIQSNEDVGYPVTRGKLVQFVKVDFGCTMKQAYKVVQIWFDGNDEEIKA